MIPTPLNTTNLPLTASLSSSLSSNKTGSSYWNTTSGSMVKPSGRSSGATGKSVPEDTVCPLCGAPHHYLYDNNGGNGQYQCKVCGQTFVTGEVVTSPVRFVLPLLWTHPCPEKDRRFFRIHKCVNPKCSFYLHNLSRVEKNIWMRITVKINTSSITSTGNSPWISSA